MRFVRSAGAAGIVRTYEVATGFTDNYTGITCQIRFPTRCHSLIVLQRIRCP